MDSSIFVNPQTWDLDVDTSGNIAVASDRYRMVQDVSTACRTFLGECWYDTTKGVPYWSDIFTGVMPPLELIKARLVEAALTVPGVVGAQVFITSIDGRQISGQIQITDTEGVIAAAVF